MDGYRHVLSDTPLAMAEAHCVADYLKAEDAAGEVDTDTDGALPAGVHRASAIDPVVNGQMPCRKVTTTAEPNVWREFCTGHPLSKDKQNLMAATPMPPTLKGHCKPEWHGQK